MFLLVRAIIYANSVPKVLCVDVFFKKKGERIITTGSPRQTN